MVCRKVLNFLVRGIASHPSEAAGALTFQTGMDQLHGSEKCQIILVVFHLGTGKNFKGAKSVDIKMQFYMSCLRLCICSS